MAVNFITFLPHFTILYEPTHMCEYCFFFAVGVAFLIRFLFLRSKYFQKKIQKFQKLKRRIK